MKAVFQISKSAYYSIGKEFAICSENASFGAGARDGVVRDAYGREDEALSHLAVNGKGLKIGFYKTWITCGGSVYAIKKEGEDYLLIFEGSRGSFENGSMPLSIRMHYVYVGHRLKVTGFTHQLISWYTKVPGNPGPFDDWRLLLNDYLTLTSPLSEGEQLQLKFEDYAPEWVNHQITGHWPMSDPHKLCIYN